MRKIYSHYIEKHRKKNQTVIFEATSNFISSGSFSSITWQTFVWKKKAIYYLMNVLNLTHFHAFAWGFPSAWNVLHQLLKSFKMELVHHHLSHAFPYKVNWNSVLLLQQSILLLHATQSNLWIFLRYSIPLRLEYLDRA